ncbi:MAG: hypothetical protein IJU33_06895 [Bacteroidales bacterium]|nr:hypothetical protein [Bacteroidales bacterium]
MKRRFLLLAAFALMALLTPLGAKGQQQLSIRQVRQLAGTNTPVAFTGTVVGYYIGFYIVQTTDAFNVTSGILVNYVDSDHPLSIGDIVSIRATKVSYDETFGVISIGYHNLTDVTVIGHDDDEAHWVRNITLEELKNAHYPATRQRVVNDIYQYTLVKVSNLTVVDHLQNSYFNEYVVEDQSGVSDTIRFSDIDSETELPSGASLRSVTAVNYRQSGGYGGSIKLFVRSSEDIEFPSLRTIHYARTHLNQTMVVEGVVNHVNLSSSYVYIQDATGGMRLNFSTNPNLAIGDRIRVQVNPETYGISTIRSTPENTCILQRLGTETITPISTDMATLYNRAELTMQWYSDNYESRIMQLTDLTVTDRERGAISGSAYLKVT